MNEYTKQAQDFLDKAGAKIDVEFFYHGPYGAFGDDVKRNVYKFTITSSDGEAYSGTFGQSVNDTMINKPPTVYDILACITKHDPGTFADFCGNYEYDTDSRKAYDVYLDVQKEYSGIARLFSQDELDLLAEIN